MKRVPLPIDDHLPAILQSLRNNPALVLVAEPGAGKTTRVPPAIIQSDLLSNEHGKLVLLQPRRVAARSAAARIADENGWQLGDQVGYQIRFERKMGRDTRIRVMTEGVFIRQAVADPFLEGIGCVVLDEFHERSLDVDLALAIVREVRAAGRDDLKVLVMSATLQAEPVAAFITAPIQTIPGRTYPVAVRHQVVPDALAMDVIHKNVDDLLTTTDGDLLVFLPGAGEIDRAVTSLRARLQADVLPLHGSLPAEAQRAAITPVPGRRRVICSTNLAETSLTIDGVTGVLDTGLERRPRFDARRGMDRLEMVPISRASADQRAGRAGRTRPGVCVRLWSEKEHAARLAFAPPEIARVDLSPTLLQLAEWGVSQPRDFGWFEPPPEAAMSAAERLLAMLELLDAGRLTPLGRAAAKLPVHPRLGRMIASATDAALVADVAALLGERDILLRDATAGLQSESDLAPRLDALAEARRRNFAPSLFDRGIDPRAAREIDRVAAQLRGLPSALSSRARRGTPPGHARQDVLTLQRLALLAYPDRVCRRRENDPTRGRMVNGGGVIIARSSSVKTAEWFVAIDGSGGDRESLVTIASAIEPHWLAEDFPHAVRTTIDCEYDTRTQRVVAIRRTMYHDLPIDEQPADTTQLDPAKVSAVLLAALRDDASSLIERDEAAAMLIARLMFLRTHLGEAELPNLTPAKVLEAAVLGKRSVASLDLAGTIEGILDWPTRQLLEREAPLRLDLPHGKPAKIDYTQSPPVLAARIQDFFGLAETPRLALGRAPVVLHLLAPNYRPQQVTQDLASFWANTYPQVRKDLRARYPKHKWPEDPRV